MTEECNSCLFPMGKSIDIDWHEKADCLFGGDRLHNWPAWSCFFLLCFFYFHTMLLEQMKCVLAQEVHILP